MSRCIMLIVVGAFLGYGTNWLAVKMLFWPRKPFKLFGRTVLHGLIPSRRPQLADSVAAAIDENLFDAEDIKKIIESKKVRMSVGRSVRSYVKKAIKEKLDNVPGPIRLVLKSAGAQERVTLLCTMITGHIMGLLPKMSNTLVKNVQKSVDIKATVRAKINDFTDDELELIVLSISARELKAITVWGLFIGAVVGAIQAGILMLL